MKNSQCRWMTVTLLTRSWNPGATIVLLGAAHSLPGPQELPTHTAQCTAAPPCPPHLLGWAALLAPLRPQVTETFTETGVQSRIPGETQTLGERQSKVTRGRGKAKAGGVPEHFSHVRHREYLLNASTAFVILFWADLGRYKKTGFSVENSKKKNTGSH